jgi:hypothetical protein
MPSGGARARSGRPIEPDALRRDRPSDVGSWVHLPASGREGEPPKWPLDRVSDRELKFWAAEWRRPQAVMWERLGMAVPVACYVRDLVIAEQPGAKTDARTLMLRHFDALGISVAGLRSHRWVIDSEPTAKQEPNDPDRRTSAKSRFKTIEGGAAS